MTKWRAWMDSIRASVEDPGFPVGMSKTVTATGVEDNGGSNPLSGIMIVKAETIEAACELAKGCPHLEHGTIEIAEALDMEM